MYSSARNAIAMHRKASFNDDLREGVCNRCHRTTMVTPEVGPDAEEVCLSCLDRERQKDYQEYLQLLQDYSDSCRA